MGEIIYPSLIPQSDLDVSEHETWAGLWNDKLCASLEAQFVQHQARRAIEKLEDRTTSRADIAHLYKYRAFDSGHPERTIDILNEQKLWSASLHSLNDPMEGGFRSGDNDLGGKGAFSFVYMMRSQWTGCICFSVNPVSQLMWSHYSSNHAGYCIKYRIADSYLLSSLDCRQVQYRNSLPDLELSDPTRLQSLVDLVFWTKAEAWEYELEWRLRYPRAQAYTHPGLLVPSDVIFGMRMPLETRQFIRDHAPQLRFGEMVATNQDYRLKVVWDDGKDGSERELAAPEPIGLSVMGGAVDDRDDSEELNPVEIAAKNPSFQLTVALAFDIAKDLLDKFQGFNPFGVVVYRGAAQILLTEYNTAASELKTGAQLSRAVEDKIREVRARENLEFAGIVSDANVRPVEGGEVRSAIKLRMEERGGEAILFTQYYSMVGEKVRLGERTATRRKRHLIP